MAQFEACGTEGTRVGISSISIVEVVYLVDKDRIPAETIPLPEQGLEQQPSLLEIVPLTQAIALSVRQVLQHDNFFELGGDSLLSVQVIAKARRAHLQLPPRQVFEHQTITEPSEVVGKASTKVTGGMITGTAPLVPSQHHFFECYHVDLHWFNATNLFDLDPPNPVLLQQATGRLLAHHDALRSRFIREASGWRQVITASEGTPPLLWIDLSALPTMDQDSVVRRAATDIQSSLDLTKGPLLRISYFDLGAKKAGRLLLIVHHLAVDGLSSSFLQEDLLTAYQQLARGDPVRLPVETTSLKHYAERLAEYAHSPEVQKELPLWQAEPERIPSVPLDYPDGICTGASLRVVFSSLEAGETRALQQNADACDVGMVEALLAALAQAFAGHYYREPESRIRRCVAVDGCAQPPARQEASVTAAIRLYLPETTSAWQ
jgi:hypothetical protein